MRQWLRRVRGALLMGVTWALVWAPVGPIIGAIVDRDGRMDEPWILVGALPGFLSGVLFSVVFGVVARRRRIADLSVLKVGAWGGVAGVLLGIVTRVIGTPNPALPIWFAPVVIGSVTLLSAGSAAASVALAKRAERVALGSGEGDELEQLRG